MNTDGKIDNGIAIVSITRRGSDLGRRLNRLLAPECRFYLPQSFADSAFPEEQLFTGTSGELIKDIFHRYRFLVLIMAAGVAVRHISRELGDKRSDPGVVVVDEAGLSSISLLSGHLGGANRLAERVASLIGARPVITTASDMSGGIAVDLLGSEFGWEIEDFSQVTEVSAALVNGEDVGLFQDAGEDWQHGEVLPDNLTVYQSFESLGQSGAAAMMIITDNLLEDSYIESLNAPVVIYRPKNIVIGIGCNRGTSSFDIERAVDKVLADHRLSKKCIGKIATIDIKKEEQGITDFAKKNNLSIEYFNKEALGNVTVFSEPSAAALKYAGVPSVCESAALLSSGNRTLSVPKVSVDRSVTVAVARMVYPLVEQKKGKLFLVGIGPGAADQMTFKAREVIDCSEVVVGYKSYIDLIKPVLLRQQVIATGMGSELSRVDQAIDLASRGRIVSLISSGDSGIYGMAALAGEILRQRPELNIDMEVVPGVTALVSSAALLGGPLSLDFASISLSDYLISWKEISRRLVLVAMGDLVTVLYNPRSYSRRCQLSEAREIFLKHRSPSTPVGIVTNAYRRKQEVLITSLEHMLKHEIGMNTTIIIGNSTTFVSRGRMFTPRGYSTKYELDTDVAGDGMSTE